MPRQGRIHLEGGIYHVIQRGIERKEIFRDDADREEFLRRLGEGLKETGNRCYGWALMPNHFHILIRAGRKPISGLMRKMLTGYALYFNHRHKRRGFLYQNRYKSILCQEESYLLELVRYIHLNPLRAKLVKDMKGLSKYKWSGHSVIVGENKADWQTTGEILERFGNKRAQAIAKYIKFIEAGKGMGRKEELSGGGLVRSAGGWQELIGLRREGLRQRGDERILGDGDFVAQVLKESDENMIHEVKIKHEGWNLDKLKKHVSGLIGIREKDIMRIRKKNKVVEAKALIAYWGMEELKLSGAELGRYFGITKQAVGYLSIRGEKLVNENNYNLSI